MKGPKRDSLGKCLRPSNMIYRNYLDNLPEAIHEFIISMDDVEGDGNCGFHVTAEQLGPFKDENHPVAQGDEVNYIRQRLLQTLRRNRDFYKSMMRGGGDHGVAHEFISFERRLHGDAVITRDHWMQMPICGFLIAKTFNCVVHSFARAGSCYTYAPPTKPCNESVKGRRLVISFVQGCHYIGLKLRPGFPIPPLFPLAFWPVFKENYSMDWCENYATEMELWRSLHPPLPCSL
ncbi:uncharacterized protein LOC113280572 [Papaver somniferum]|uniref:uncharacterized protein LOC113280572 n=1 Tax=Papaver somniferum TaxID=3469 RepID=UPI000E6FB887|nr:uncharacterized protein LOC113280572 [Papaver somniferum]